MRSKIYICRAHDRREPGCHIPGMPECNEWMLSKEFCRGAAAALKDSKHEVEILGATLGIRIACLRDYCRKHPGVEPVAVEIHCNKMPSRPLQRGWYVLAWYKSAAAVELAQAIVREVRRVRPDKCRGVCKVSHDRRWIGTAMEYQDRNLAFLENLPCPSVIIETGYLSNEIDAKWIRVDANRYAFGAAVGRGIKNFLEDRNGKVSKS